MILPSEMFSYNKDTKTLTAFASDGPLHIMFKPGLGIPLKLYIKSHRTGNTITAEYLSRRVSEGDLVSWTYHNYEHSLSVTIFND